MFWRIRSCKRTESPSTILSISSYPLICRKTPTSSPHLSPFVRWIVTTLFCLVVVTGQPVVPAAPINHLQRVNADYFRCQEPRMDLISSPKLKRSHPHITSHCPRILFGGERERRISCFRTLYVGQEERKGK